MKTEDIIENKTILITGGTGELGQQFVSYILKNCNPKKLIVFSNNELEQSFMRKQYIKEGNSGNVRFFLGDVRDKERLYRAFRGVDYVVHMASMNDEVTCEYNPREAILTNVLGTQNVIEVAIDCNVEKVVMLSTEKAVYPSDMCGSVKLVADHLMIAGNLYSGDGRTSFSVVRLGNIVGNRFSDIVEIADELDKESNEINVSDYRETRFWTPIEFGIEMIFIALRNSSGGEIFVGKVPSYKKIDLIKALKPDVLINAIGITHETKLNEVLLTKEEAVCTYEYDSFYVVYPYRIENYEKKIIQGGNKLEYGFCYNSANNTEWLSEMQIRKLVDEYMECVRKK